MRWGNRRRKTCEGLFFLHPSAEPFKAFFGGMFDECHVLSQVLLGVDSSLFASFQLGQSKLRDRGAVLLVQLFPDRCTLGLFGDRVPVAGWIGCP